MTQNVPLEVTVADVKSLMENGSEFLLLDCREQSEYETAKIEGSKLLPMSEIADRVEELEQHRDAHIIVHCHHGGRSLRVTNWLRDQKFANVQNMAGGIDQWSLEIDESVPRY